MLIKQTHNGIPTINSFFNIRLAEKIRNEYQPAAIITANNVFAHADNLKEILQSVHHLLDEDGIFVFEVSYLGDVVEKTLFDTIYHEHLAYHSVSPLVKFFSAHDLEIICVKGQAHTEGALDAPPKEKVVLKSSVPRLNKSCLGKNLEACYQNQLTQIWNQLSRRKK